VSELYLLDTNALSDVRDFQHFAGLTVVDWSV